jgi:hypothetical protein
MDTESPNLNTGVLWAESDTSDLIWCVNDGQSVEEIADFLCRTEEEVRDRLAEFGLTEAEKL